MNKQGSSGNKMLTTFGGGMVLSHNNEAIAKMRFWSTQAHEPVIWYEHKEYGYNYRLSNVCAGIGRGQLECLDLKLKRRREIHDRYTEELKGLPLRIKQERRPGANYWLSILVSEDEHNNPNTIIARLQNAQIESRSAWKPMHMQPIYRTNPFVTVEGNGRGRTNAYIKGSGIDVGADIFRRGLCLPSDNKMTEEQQDRIIEIIHRCFL